MSDRIHVPLLVEHLWNIYKSIIFKEVKFPVKHMEIVLKLWSTDVLYKPFFLQKIYENTLIFNVCWFLNLGHIYLKFYWYLFFPNTRWKNSS